jgi:IS30 family transposase
MTDFDTFNNQQIKQIQYKLNSRPGAGLNFYSSKRDFLPVFAEIKVAFSS